MINIALHIIFVLVVLYYVFINNTDYDRSLYQSTNDIHKYLYKKQISNKRYIKYNEKQNNKEEDRLEHIQKKKEACDKCEDLHTSRNRRTCRDRENCAYLKTIETFTNQDNSSSDKSVNKTQDIFIELKIIFMMIICIVYASQQHYGRSGGISLYNIFNVFTGGLENVIFLLYICVLLIFIYIELEKLYGN